MRINRILWQNSASVRRLGFNGALINSYHVSHKECQNSKMGIAFADMEIMHRIRFPLAPLLSISAIIGLHWSDSQSEAATKQVSCFRTALFRLLGFRFYTSVRALASEGGIDEVHV